MGKCKSNSADEEKCLPVDEEKKNRVQWVLQREDYYYLSSKPSAVTDFFYGCFRISADREECVVS